MAAPLLHLTDIKLSFGNTQLLDGAELSVAPRDRICLVGRNGSGKSTLLKIAAGLVEADSGGRFAQPGATVRYLPQEPDLSGYDNTRAYVEAGLVEGDDPNRAFYLLGSLGLSGEEKPANLSGGEARRAALARVLAPRPDVLLLDEPTNHLDLPAIEWLEGELGAMAGALVLISHDRRFLETLAHATIWLDRGETHRLEKSFAHFEAWRDAKLAQEETERHKLERRIAEEEHWMRYGVTARRKRNVGRLERLRGMRTERREQLRSLGSVKMEAAEGAGGGTKVIDAKGVSFAYGAGENQKEIVRDFSLRIHRGNRIGVVGPNGAGKTTLLKLLLGELQPAKGNVKLGQGLQIAQLDQKRTRLHPDQSLAAAVTDGSGDMVMVAGKPRHVMSYLQDFLFSPAQARTPVKVLSGGERARLLLAKLFAMPSNFLVLDEPTNDLDLETLDLLEEVIADYPGTALVVSHDRDFLDRVATQIVAAEGDGRFAEYAGGYSDMLAQKGAPEPAAKAPRKEAPERPKKARAAKLNFSDAHALKVLPQKIAAAEGEIAALEEKLSDSGLYARDPAAFAELSAKLAEIRKQKDADEERWLALEMLREELEAG